MNTKKLGFITIASSVGSVLEMYDFVIYIFMAPVITKLFFPHSDSYLALLQVFSIFAVGYLSRPIGGIIFGHIGDRYGRQKGLILSMILMGIPIFLIGCLPTYKNIGGAAPLLLLILRFLVGISIGGEFPSGTAYLTEHAPAKYRGFISSFLFFGINLGTMLASFVGAMLVKYISETTLYQWGWRFPFLFGGLLAILGFFIRKRMVESPIFLEYQKAKKLSPKPITEMLRFESRQISRSFTIVSVMAAAISVIFLFMPTFLNEYLQLPLEQALTANTINLVIFSCFIPLFAWLSDITSRNFILSIGAYGFLFLSLPLYDGMSHGLGGLFYVCLISLGIISAMIVGPISGTLAERFRSRYRTSGIALSYNLSFGLVGGLAPLAVTYLLHMSKTNLAPSFYMMITALISLIAIINLRDFSTLDTEQIEKELLQLGKQRETKLN